MLKKKFTKIALAASLALSAGAAQAANTYDIAGNGGFETGDFTDWTVFEIGSTSASSVSTDNPASGTYSGLAQCGFGPCDTLLKNNNRGIGEAEAFGSITIEFDYRGTQGPGGVIFAELFSELDGGGVSNSELLFGGPLFGTDNWQTDSITTTLGSNVDGGVTLQLKSSCGPVDGCISDAYFDNVRMLIEPPAAVPVPAAVWLFGSGLLGLVGVARRKKAA